MKEEKLKNLLELKLYQQMKIVQVINLRLNKKIVLHVLVNINFKKVTKKKKLMILS